MKNIEVTDEMYEFLKELKEELVKQDNRCTASPFGYIFTEDVYRASYWEEDADKVSYYKDSEVYSEDALKELFEEYKFDEPDKYDDFEEFADTYEKIYENLKTQEPMRLHSANFFLTEKASKEHMLINGHNMPESTRDYIIHLYRNDEMKRLVEFIKSV